MAIEIERKFLVRDDGWKASVVRTTRIRQGYLCEDRGTTLRVRTRDDVGYLTVKGERSGLARPEFEYEIPLNDAVEMLKLAVATVDKFRHEVEHEGKTWEVDVFEGPNAPLVVAELELSSDDEKFESPQWLGEEVSENPAYSNSRLAQRPYSQWER
jgi:adenylate cyclase